MTHAKLSKVKNMLLTAVFAFPFLLNSPLASQEQTLGYIVEQAAQGLDLDLAVLPRKNIEDSEHVISEISPTIVSRVLDYLRGHGNLDIDTDINEMNYCDYLSAAKYCDLTTSESHVNSTYPIRLACFHKSNGNLKTLEAFSYRLNHLFFGEYDENGTFLPNKKFELYNASQFDLSYVPEWINVQQRVVKEVVETVCRFSDQLGYNSPHLLLFTGNYGAGKSYQVQNHPLTRNIKFDSAALFNGILGTDAVKRVYMALVPGATNQQVHHEGVAIRLQIMKTLFAYFPNVSIIQEAVMSNENSINDQFALAHDNHLKVNLVDVDADLEIACMRILTRDPKKGDSVPHFRAIVSAEKMIRTSRTILHQKVQSSDDINPYELFFSDREQVHLVAQKRGDRIEILPGQEAHFKQAFTATDPIIVEEIAQRIITQDDCLIFGDRLKQFVGMRLEDALLKLSKI